MIGKFVSQFELVRGLKMAIYSGMLAMEVASRVVVRLPSLSSVKAAAKVS